MVKYCNRIKFKLNNHSETNEINTYVKICQTQNVNTTYTAGHNPELLGQMD